MWIEIDVVVSSMKHSNVFIFKQPKCTGKYEKSPNDDEDRGYLHQVRELNTLLNAYITLLNVTYQIASSRIKVTTINDVASQVLQFIVL